MILGVYLGCMGIFDYREKKIPVWLLVPGVVIGIAGLVYRIWEVVAKCAGQGSIFLNLVFSMTGLFPGILLLLVAWSSKKIGYGDGIVILCLGGILEYSKIAGILLWSFALMSVCSLVLLLLKKVNKESTLPFLPFLFLGYVLWIGFGQGGLL